MTSEIFRFAVVRPPQTTSLDNVAENSFFLSDSDEGLVDNLRKAKKENDKPKMIKLAQGYTKSSKFIDSAKKVDTKLIEFIDVLNSKSKNYNQFLRENFQRIFALTPLKFINSPVYKQTYKIISESLVAAAIDNTVSPKSKSLIVNLVKALQVTNLMVKDKPVTREQVSQIKIILPSDIFRLPLLNTNLKEHRKKQSETKKKAIEERQKKNLALSQELKSYTTAIDEILKVFDNSNLDDDDLPADAAKRKAGFFMPKKAVQKISADTKNVIKKVGLSAEEIDIVKTVNAIEKYTAETAQKIYAGAGRGGRMARIGSNDVAIFEGDFDIPLISVLDPAAAFLRTPGVCPPVNITVDDSPTPIINDNNGKHDVRILGIADLLIVEQELARYELGEIAHIENVLKSELRDRKHRINNITEESVTTETEETDTKENDLSSTERFELQTESQKVINESTSIEAGATVSASYGYVDATANFNYSNSDSSSETQRSASNFARETTSKAVSKLEKRNLERRFRRTVRETEETNQHTFDNKAGTDNITGVYRFVDKIYNAQIINYGKRLMLEFIVPEPAAFLRHAMTNQPVETGAIKPEEPGYCTGYGRRFEPLQVQDIDRTNYLIWASKYGVEGITAPPPRVKIFSAAKVTDGSTFKEFTLNHKTGNDSFDVNIDSGYIPQEANILIHGFHFLEMTTLIAGENFVLQIQDKRISKDLTMGTGVYPIDNVKLNKDFTKSIPVTIGVIDYISYEVIVNIICTLSYEKFDTWKMETYNAIMNAYKDQLTRYNNAIESARIRAGFTEIRGTNPFMNRETEKTELKKGCITLLTGQQFEAFDAMNQNVGVNGYPEIDFDEAAEEGKFISFFEQAFEWNNMTYLFYPYFWANKQQWLQLSQLKDTDPIFTKFLQAGSCRVNIPVRMGFENNMLNYLNSTATLWNAEGILVNSEDGEPDAMHISVVEELKSQMNNMNIEGAGKLNVTKESNVVTGVDTMFSIEDENKRIIIGGKTYIIKLVDSPNAVKLKTAYTGETQTGLAYSFGAKLVGEPWEVKLPTDLVKISVENTDINI